MKWKSKTSFPVLLLSVLFSVFLTFSNAFNVFAETKDYQNFALRFRYFNGTEYVSQSMLYNDPKFNVRYVDRTAAAIGSVTVPSGANFMSVTAKYNLVAFTDSGNRSDLPYNNSTDPFVYEASINNVMKNFENSSVIVHQTDWVCDPLNSGVTTWCRTFTYEVSFVIRDIPASITKISWGVEYPGRLQTNYSYGANYYFEGTPDNRAVIGFSFDYESALLEQQNQLIMISNQSLSNIDQGISNLSNQMEQQHEETYNYLTDNTPPIADTSVLSGSAGWLPPGPVDSILNLPIQLVQGIVGVFSNTNTCSPIRLPLGLIDYTLEIPCMRPFFELSGVNVVWNTVGSIISAFLVYNTLKWLYRFVDDTLTFRENESTMWGGL